VATALEFWALALDVNPTRAGAWMQVWIWPVLLVLDIVWGRDRVKVALAFALYALGLALLCLRVAWVGAPPIPLGPVTIPGALT
ncbi:hypothetical protein NL526_29425, partial [Klebsiella pneumoniae]|nr:hypothetical protein [Klebsiella pneumoniae]